MFMSDLVVHLGCNCYSVMTSLLKKFFLDGFWQEVNFMPMETSKGDVLEGFQKLLGSILVPVLQKQEVF